MKWNALQEKHGYLTTDSFNKPVSEINSTDVHSVINEDSIIKYMLKYFSKSEPDKRPINGKLWDASENLNQSAIVLNESQGAFLSAHSMLEDDRIADKTFYDFHQLYIYKRKVFDCLPISVREEFKQRVLILKSADKPQYQFSTESFY
jgi:hypothetical protein